MSRILFLANLVPFPADNGGKIFTKSVLMSLSKDHIIDLVCFYENENIEDAKKELEHYCVSITFVKAKITTKDNYKAMIAKAFVSLFSKKPLAVLKFENRQMKKELRKRLSCNKYDYVFFNILSMFVYSDFVKKIDPRIVSVLYEQNCESLIYERMAKNTSNFLKRLFIKNEKRKLSTFEKKSIKKADKLIFLSNEDKLASGVNRDSFVIPIGLNSNFVVKKNSFDGHVLRMLFVGTLTWAPNNDGLVWFLENVMPFCPSDRCSLTIVGKNPSDKVRELSSSFDNVSLLGYVEDLEEIYKSTDVAVVPLFVGSGQRVKILEAFARGFPVISTSVGVEGLTYSDGYSILIADNPNTFIDKINECYRTDKLYQVGTNSRKVFLENYSSEVISKKLGEVFK